MSELPTRKQAVEVMLDIGRRMEQRGYVVANDGNLSCLLEGGTILSTPTGVSKGHMTEEMLIETDRDGNVLYRGSKPPSSELKMHLRVYKENPKIGGVVHAHPITATSFAAAGIPLDEPILTEAVTAIGSIPVAHFALPGTEEVPDSIAPFCNIYNGTLLANHGVITWAPHLELAFFRLEWVEVIAKATLITKYLIGRCNRLSCDQTARFDTIREKLGITLGGKPMCVPQARNSEDVLPSSGPVSEDNVEDPRTHAIALGVMDALKQDEDLLLDQLQNRLVERISEQVVDRIGERLKDEIADRIIDRLNMAE